MTGPAWSASNEPSKTDRRSKARWSRGDRRSWLQATAPSSVRCRAGTSRAPLPGSGSRAARRSRIADSGRSDTRAAASSMPSGSPSTSAQTLVDDRAVRARVPAGPDGPRPLDEEPSRGRVLAADAERRHRHLVLAGHAQRGAARDDEARSGRDSDDLGDARGGVDDVLEVVQDEQHRALGKERRQRLDRGSRCAVEQADRPGDQRLDVGRVLDRRERHEPRPVGVLGLDRAGRLGGDARLADAARAGDGHEPGVVEQRPERLDLVVAPDEGRQPRLEVADRRPAGADRRKLGRQPRDVELVQPLGPGHVLEDVQAEVAGGRAGRQVVSGELEGRAGEDDLAAVPDRCDAGGPADLDPAVVVAGAVGLAAVDAHPDADGRVLGPGVGLERALGGDGGGDRGAGFPECGEHGIALGPDDGPTMGVDGGPDQRDVRGVDVVPALAERPGEDHRTLDVGPEERDGAGGQRRTGNGLCVRLVGGHCSVIRSARVASIAIAASGRSRRIAFSPCPLITRARAPFGPAATVAERGAWRRTASSPTCSPAR